MSARDNTQSNDFIREIIAADNHSNKWGGRIITRFPPEPNGFLHIGHAKAICLNFSIAEETGGTCHLRFDDTNPSREEDRYVSAIIEDVNWLGWNACDHLYYASDYFDQLFSFARTLIKQGQAYVDDSNAEEIRESRGTLTTAGVNSPHRDRSIERNLELFQKMADGEFHEGSRVLRAKIDMRSPNLNMRDPVMYRIIESPHHRTGSKWAIYPMYDFAHGQSDSIEGITHSICTMEFEDHRPLYDWFLDQLSIHHPQQIEFARLNLTYTVLSKRKLLQLVDEQRVDGWDDPRMPTLSGMRRRGFTPASVKQFCTAIGVARRQNTVESDLLHHYVRNELNHNANRAFAVLNPIKLVIDNYPRDHYEEFEAPNHPSNPTFGTHTLKFSRELYIDSTDFMVNPTKGFFRLSLGTEVRLKYAYIIRCTDFTIDDTTGQVSEIHCVYDPETKGGQTPDNRKVRGTIHWLSTTGCENAEIRLYDHLFIEQHPDKLEDLTTGLNPLSKTVLTNCKIEPRLVQASTQDRYQFERSGYFCIDDRDSRPDAIVFNRIVTLRESVPIDLK